MRNYASENFTCTALRDDGSLTIVGAVFFCGAFRDWLTDRLYVTVQLSNPIYSTDLREVLVLECGGITYPFAEAEGWDGPVAEVSWKSALSGLSIGKKKSYSTLTDNGREVDSVPLELCDFQTMPALPFSPTLYANHTRILSFAMELEDGRRGAATGLTLFTREPGEETWDSTVLFRNVPLSAYTLETDSSLLGKEAYLAVEYRTFPAEGWDGQSVADFVTLNRMTTPVRTVSGDGELLFTPVGLTCSMLLSGGSVTVTWKAAADSEKLYDLSHYVLERAAAVGEDLPAAFGQLYAGPATRFRDTLPAGADTVAYRVKAVSTLGPASAWCETGPASVVKSNVYVGIDGEWVRAAAVQVGSRKASPMLRVGR